MPFTLIYKVGSRKKSTAIIAASFDDAYKYANKTYGKNLVSIIFQPNVKYSPLD